jgi:RNA polymerase sigma-70 factor, ECF subfamily
MLTAVKMPAIDNSAPSLEGLLELVAGGDRSAFARLYDETSHRLFGLIRRLLVDTAQSEEVTQEVYLEIWQTASRYDPTKGRGISWMMTLAHRRAVDRVRASQASRDRDYRVGIAGWSPDIDSVTEIAEIDLEMGAVHDALRRLTAFQREAISLTYFGGYTNSEVAAILHIPVGTVKTRLRDGLIRLRDELGVAS